MIFQQNQNQDDVLKKQKLTGVVFYGAASCNLTCSYCYISKNSTLKKIDEENKQMFLDGSYIKTIQQTLEQTGGTFSDITRLEFWGGEPFLGIHNFLNNCDDFLDKINLQKVSVSSNFVSLKMLENTFAFFDKFNSYGKKNEKTISIDFQISIDGDENITDKNRGEGVTKLLTTNFKEILNYCEKFPYLRINFHTKPTLSIENIKNFNTEQDVINYYYSFIKNLGESYNNIKPWNATLGLTVPNFATPIDYTKEDGILWNEKISLFIEADKKMRKNEDFKLFYSNYNSLVPFLDRAKEKKYNSQINKNHSKIYSHYCGSFLYNIVLLPDHSLGTCHHSLYDLYNDYLEAYNLDKDLIVKDKKVFNNKTFFSINEFAKMRDKIWYLYSQGSLSRLSSVKNLITLYADCGLIYPIYKKEMDNNNLASFVFAENNCIYYHIKKFSSLYMHDAYSLLLWGNGAFEKLLDYMNILKEREKQ